MTLKIKNKQNFIQNFLNPISKINDLCSLILENNSIYSFNRTSDSSFTLFSYTEDIEYEGERKTLSFSEIKKFCKAFECIPQDTDIVLNLNENNIEYKSHINKFKFHLISDNIVRGPNYSIEKLNSLEFDLDFKLTYDTYINLIKSSTFISTEKIYIFTENGKVYAELTDKTKNNVDSYSMILSDEFTGKECPTPLAFDFNIFRSIYTKKTNEVIIKLNTKGIVAFIITFDKYNLKYISTAHVS